MLQPEAIRIDRVNRAKTPECLLSSQPPKHVRSRNEDSLLEKVRGVSLIICYNRPVQSSDSGGTRTEKIRCEGCVNVIGHICVELVKGLLDIANIFRQLESNSSSPEGKRENADFMPS